MYCRYWGRKHLAKQEVADLPLVIANVNILYILQHLLASAIGHGDYEKGKSVTNTRLYNNNIVETKYGRDQFFPFVKYLVSSLFILYKSVKHLFTDLYARRS